MQNRCLMRTEFRHLLQLPFLFINLFIEIIFTSKRISCKMERHTLFGGGKIFLGEFYLWILLKNQLKV